MVERLKEFIAKHGGVSVAVIDAWIVQATNGWNHENWRMRIRKQEILEDVEWGLQQGWPTPPHTLLSDFEQQISNASNVPLGVPSSTPPNDSNP